MEGYELNGKTIAIPRIDSFLQQSIDTWKIPGAVILLVKNGKTLLHKAYGYAQVMPEAMTMEKDSLFDLASLTKVIATWPAIMFLVERNVISLQDPLSRFYGQSIDSALKNATVFQLLTHTSGLSERTYLIQYGKDKETILQGILTAGLEYPPDKQVKYSNRGYVLLGDVIEKASGMPLDVFLTQHVWEPLGMKDTMFNPDDSFIDRVVATEYLPERKMVKRGIVHDENAELLGGVAGHAGTFSTAMDVGIFCEMILDALDNEPRLFASDLTIHSFINYTKELNEGRGLAWQIFHEADDSKIVGHYGFTGTTVWLDLKKKIYMVLLTNRVHPSRDNSNIHSIRAYLKEQIFGVN